MNIYLYYNDFVNIKIYDNKNNLLSDDIINNFIYYDFSKGIYLVKIFYYSNIIGIYVLLHKNDIDYYNLYSYRCIKRNAKVFYLYDYYYKNLKIQKGEIILGT